MCRNVSTKQREESYNIGRIEMAAGIPSSSGKLERVLADFQAAQFHFALVELARDDSGKLDDSLARICGVAASTLDVSRASVWLFNDAHTALHCAYLYDRDHNREERGGVLDVARYPMYFATLEECRTIAADDAVHDLATAEFALGYLDALGITSMLDVPIRREGRTVGVVCHEHTGPRRSWRPEEKNFAASLADLTALVLETDNRRRYNQRLKLLRETDQAILSAQSIGEIADAALAGVRSLVPCRRASVAVFEPEGGEARLVGVAPARTEFLEVGAVIAQAAFGDPEDLRGGKPFLAANPVQAPDTPVRAALEADGIRSFVSVPMLAHGELIGTLNLGSDEACAFSGEHVEIAQEVADSLAVAIRDARLHQQVKRHAEELEDRVAERTAELSEVNARLRESEERIRSLYDNTPVMMHSVDAQGRLLEVNEFWLRTLGYERDEVIGQPVEKFAAPDMRSHVRDVLMPRLAREGFLKDEEVHAVRKNGEIVELRVSSRVKSGPDGEFQRSQTFLLDITEQRRAQRENVYLQEELQSEWNFEEIVGASAAIQNLFRSIEMVAATDSTVLLLGETGTGKELIARALHNRSARNRSVMVKVNCGALPSGLVESDLFGHEKGAFTSAVGQKKGRFELAHRGTLFLDEVG
ncbi:MAG: sigma 54-interacting transcriptional regulator, partial [Bryobacteraceae bacterium]